jgi:hypothetical protein
MDVSASARLVIAVAPLSGGPAWTLNSFAAAPLAASASASSTVLSKTAFDAAL